MLSESEGEGRPWLLAGLSSARDEYGNLLGRAGTNSSDFGELNGGVVGLHLPRMRRW